MDIIWTCPLCVHEVVDTNSAHCNECNRGMHKAHITDHKCSECREKLGLDRSTDPRMYLDYPQLQLRLRTH